MKPRAVACPNCGGPLRTAEGKGIARCAYCGSDVAIGQTVPAGEGKIAHWLRLAEAAGNAGNHREALGYFAKVLEADSHNYRAWFGRAEALGHMPIPLSLRLREMVTALKNGMEYAPGDQKAELGARGARSIMSVAVAHRQLGLGQSSEVTVTMGESAQFGDEYSAVTEALEYSQTLSPGDEETAEGITLSWDDARRVRVHIRKPSIGPLRARASRSRECFVASASLGSPDHPAVAVLTEFRDVCLMQRRAGRAFVSWYCRFGPHAARLVSRNRVLQRLSYWAVVRPSAWLAARLLVRHHP